MLVLSRKPGEALVIGGDITVTVVEIKGNRVQVAIDAPDSTHIVREELTGWLDLPISLDARSYSADCTLMSLEEDQVEPDVVLTV
ncbi:MAG TPA: carbon storage regulator [Gemmataceae bacterium]|jgi:carbon storage regulator